MVKLLSVLAFGLILAGCAEEDTGPEEPTGEVTGTLRCVQTPTGTFCHAAEPWPLEGPNAGAADAVSPPKGAFCTNGQCFDGGSGPPKGNGVDAWDWDHCVGACFLCDGICAAHCTQVGWCHP